MVGKLTKSIDAVLGRGVGKILRLQKVEVEGRFPALTADKENGDHAVRVRRDGEGG